MPSKKMVEEEFMTKVATYRLEKIRCSKKNCSKCPHGPYWYAYYRAKGKERVKYIGKALKLLPFDKGFTRGKSGKRLSSDALFEWAKEEEARNKAKKEARENLQE